MKFESSFKEVAKASDSEVENSKGRNLAMSAYSSNDESVEVIDYTELLNNVAQTWKSSKKTSSEKKKPTV